VRRRRRQISYKEEETDLLGEGVDRSMRRMRRRQFS
jgi:hypothetical protein